MSSCRVGPGAHGSAPSCACFIHFDPFGRTIAITWCTCARSVGRISPANTHVSSLKGADTAMYVYSTVPLAGIAIGFGISKTRSGRMFHPSRKATGAGASFGLPAGAP